MVLIYKYICYKLELQTNWLYKFFFKKYYASNQLVGKLFIL